MRNKKFFRMGIAGLLSLSMLGTTPAMAADFAAEDVPVAEAAQEAVPQELSEEPEGLTEGLQAEDPGELTAAQPEEISQEEVEALSLEEEGEELEAAGDVTINAANFPDSAFRTYVAGFDDDSDGILSVKEINAVDSIYVPDKKISNLTGVNVFVNATELICPRNNLTSLDISKLTRLETLNCSNNKLTTLKAPSQMVFLEYADISNNKLTTQPIPLKAYANTGASYERCPLVQLNCSNNQIAGTLNTGYMTGTIDAANNKITAVKGGAVGMLCTGLYLEGNAGLKTLNLSGYMDHIPTRLTYPSTCTVTLVKAPGFTKIENLSGTQNKIYYTKTNFRAGYQIQRYDAASKKWTAIATSAVPSTDLESINVAATYTDKKNLVPGKNYKYRVRAYVTIQDRNGTKKNISAFSGIKTSALVPAAPTSISGSSSGGKVTIKWNKSNGATGYQVYRFTSAANAKANKSGTRVGYTTKSTVLNMVDSKATKGKTYYYKVRPYRKISGKNVYSNFTTKYVTVKVK